MNDSTTVYPISVGASTFPLPTSRHVLQSLSGISIPISGLCGLALYFLWLSTSAAPVVNNVRIAGYRSLLEPTFLLRMRFLTNAAKVIRQGYSDVFFSIRVRLIMVLIIQKVKDSFFIVKRMDTDITIVPQKYLDELRLSPPEKLSSTHANIHVSSSYSVPCV